MSATTQTQLPAWPTGQPGPIERSILHELDDQERINALHEAQRAIRERGGIRASR